VELVELSVSPLSAFCYESQAEENNTRVEIDQFYYIPQLPEPLGVGLHTMIYLNRALS
jgi:hypothetical protein